MTAGITARAAIALFAAATFLLAWKLLGLTLIYRAKRAGRGEAGVPEGFVRGKPGFLIFGSPRCAPCVHAQKPAVRKLAGELGESIQLIEVDVTQEPLLAERYGVLSLPTVFLFDAAGRPRRVNHGLVTAEELRRQISPYLA